MANIKYYDVILKPVVTPKRRETGGRSWKDDCRYCKSHFGRRREKIS